MSITKRSYPSSARHPRGLTAWRVRWLEGTRHRSREFASREEARIFEAQVLVDGGVAPALARECPTLAALWEPWLANRKARMLPATTAVYESVWGKHIQPALGHFRLDALERNPRLLSEFLASLGARDRRTGKPRVGASAHRKAHWVLKALLRTAVAWNHIATNPMDRIEDRAPSPKRARQVVVFSAMHVETMRARVLERH